MFWVDLGGWRDEIPKSLSESFSTVQEAEKMREALSAGEQVFQFHSLAANFALEGESCLSVCWAN